MNANQAGEWDTDILANEFEELELQEWGLELPGMQELPETTEDGYDPNTEIETDIVLGDVITIGRHRLMCGDSTNADDVSKLLNGATPYLMVTDPPYGVEYDADWRNKAIRSAGGSSTNRATGAVKNDGTIDWGEAYSISPCNVFYIWHAAWYAAASAGGLAFAGLDIRNQIIWNKSQIAISRGAYHWKHEPCWYAVKKGAKAKWIGDRKQNTVWDIDKPHQSDTGHSTQKPVECMARPIRNHEGDVYDPFIGSGTTMVAAEQLNRVCYGMEINPIYCQVIINRMRESFPDIEIAVNASTP